MIDKTRMVDLSIVAWSRLLGEEMVKAQMSISDISRIANEQGPDVASFNHCLRAKKHLRKAIEHLQMMQMILDKKIT